MKVMRNESRTFLFQEKVSILFKFTLISYHITLEASRVF